METKRNLKYFLSHGPSVFLFVALGLVAVGLVLAFASGRNSGLLMVGVLIVLVGVMVMLFSSGGKANEVDIDMTCMELTKDLEEAATKNFEVYERSYLRMIHPIFLRAYDFAENDKLLVKKASDGKLRSNMFNGVYMFFTNDNMYVFKRHLCVTEDDSVSNDGRKTPYSKLTEAMLEEHPVSYMNGKKEESYTDWYFVVKSTEGEVLRMSVEAGADIDKAVEDINHLFKVKHDNPTDRLATEGGKYQTNR